MGRGRGPAALTMPRAWRAYHPGLVAERGVTIELSADEAHHIRRVLRLAVGEILSVFDGAGVEWACVVERSAAQGVSVRLVSPVHEPVEPILSVRLFHALCRPEATDSVVRKATEVGVASIHLVPAERSEAGRPSPARLERWSRIAVAACKQCGRRVVPPVALVDRLPAVDPGVRGLLLDPDPSRPTIGSSLAVGEPCPVALAVGPEGGFAADEVARAIDGGWCAVTLGPRTLRTETAAVVAVAIVLHAWGDLGPRQV